MGRNISLLYHILLLLVSCCTIIVDCTHWICAHHNYLLCCCRERNRTRTSCSINSSNEQTCFVSKQPTTNNKQHVVSCNCYHHTIYHIYHDPSYTDYQRIVSCPPYYTDHHTQDCSCIFSMNDWHTTHNLTCCYYFSF